MMDRGGLDVPASVLSIYITDLNLIAFHIFGINEALLDLRLPLMGLHKNHL